MTRRIARLVDRASGQVTTELDLSALTEAEFETWYLRQAADGRFVSQRLVWVDDPLGDDL